MKVEIRPAICGTELRYEAYEVQEKFSLFRGCCRKYKLLYFRKGEDGSIYPTDDWGYSFGKQDYPDLYRRSASSLKQMGEWLKDCYGNSIRYSTWRPSHDQ